MAKGIGTYMRGFCPKGFLSESARRSHIAQKAECRTASDHFANRQARSPTPPARHRTPDSPGQSEDAFREDDAEVRVDEPEDPIPRARSETPGPQPNKCVRTETPDLDYADCRFRESYPELAGVKIKMGQTKFEKWEDERNANTRWAPFHNEKEWKLAEWVVKVLGQKETDEFLKLEQVRASSDGAS
ncbi:hypothetical protein OF83DRAFT_1171371 [Amylostereum chailletii]|nr:hypothetical protein OF83DRAFT_1171371 [Amylostereum chailletii]